MTIYGEVEALSARRSRYYLLDAERRAVIPETPYRTGYGGEESVMVLRRELTGEGARESGPSNSNLLVLNP
jgi:hypothetical protein